MARIMLFEILCVTFILTYANGESQTSKYQRGMQYPKGYDYIPENSGLYKLHTELNNFPAAIKICEDEGATLFYPDTETELNSVTSYMANKYKESLPNEIYLGWVKKGNGYETYDGVSSNVPLKWNGGEPNNLHGIEDRLIIMRPNFLMADVTSSRTCAFICKMRMNEWNEECQFSDSEYGYNEEMGKCYKFHLTPKTWSQAQDTCRAEHSQLAVINSREEAAYLVRLTRSVLRRIPGRFTHGVVLLGFHNNNVEDWQTVDGTSLYFSGYACWGNAQPDGGEQARCGSMFYNGHLNDIGCDQKAFFICEHDNDAINFVREPQSFYNVIEAVRCHDII